MRQPLQGIRPSHQYFEVLNMALGHQKWARILVYATIHQPACTLTSFF